MWLVNLVCDLVQVRSSRYGSTVRMRMNRIVARTGRAMPECNVGTVRSSHEAFPRRDLDGFLSYHDPDIEFRSLVLEVADVVDRTSGQRTGSPH